MKEKIKYLVTIVLECIDSMSYANTIKLRYADLYVNGDINNKSNDHK